MKTDKPKTLPNKPSKKQDKKPGKKSEKTGKADPSGYQGNAFLFFKPEYIFLIFSVIFGLSFVFTIPPFQVPDEASHMFRVYELTKFHLQVEEQNNVPGNYRPPSPDNKVVGNYLPSSFDSVQGLFAYLKFYPQNKVKSGAIGAACSIKVNPGKQKFTEMTAGNYSFFSYMPQLPAVIIGRLLNLNVLPVLYLGRIFALAFFILCTWYAIKIIPFGKNTFLVLAFIPMSMTLVGSYSADCVIISLSFLTLALIFNLSHQKGIDLKNKKLILLIATISLFGLLKLNYFPWVLMILLIPPKVFIKKREYYLTLLITFFISTLLCAGWTYFVFGNQVHNANILVKDIVETPAHQIGLLVHNPHLLIDVLRSTWAAKGQFYEKSLIGVLGYLDTIIPDWIYSGYYWLLLIVALLDINKNFQLSIYQRVVILVLSLGICVATIFAMYIFDGVESRGTVVVEGVQGRYFIPPLISILFVIYGILPFKNFFWSINKFIPVVLFIFCFVVLYQTEYTLYLRYFVSGNDYFNYVKK